MHTEKSTIRLVYPQWQGGDIARLVPEIGNPATASRGYVLGAQLLNFLAPDNGMPVLTVPIDVTNGPRETTDGVLDRDTIIRQTRTALEMLRANAPDRIVTLGGECSVSVVPFTFLAARYDGDLAVIWIDAHPDITLPGDAYTGYHAMAVTACMGYGDPQIVAQLPARIEASKILLVGVRNWERDEIVARQRQYGLQNFTKDELADGGKALRTWLASCGTSKVAIHLDLDVLDPKEIVAAAGPEPDGMTIDEVVGIIDLIAKEKELVGLTVAEPMPRTALRIKEMLGRLPLIG